jgi:hypothetical protein
MKWITALVITFPILAHSDMNLDNLRTSDVTRLLATEAQPARMHSLQVGTARVCRIYWPWEYDDEHRLIKPGFKYLAFVGSDEITSTGKPSPTSVVALHDTCSIGTEEYGGSRNPLIFKKGKTFTLHYKDEVREYIWALPDGTLIVEAELNKELGINSFGDQSLWARYYMVCPPSGKHNVCH